MPQETNTNVAPYFDDFDQAKEFYKILFKPSAAVQVRELNQMQSIFQNQIERFGSHVFKNGTIISGVNFQYIPFYPYVKINDINTLGQPVDPLEYQPYWVKNSANVIAKIVNYKTGVEQDDPNLNTLYIKYLNSGTSCSALSFSNTDVLTVFDTEYPIFSIGILNGGSGFSNSDTVVVTSAITINVASGSFQNNETITQSTTLARATILEVNTTALASSTVLKIKPLTADLANLSANSSKWEISTSYNITGNTSGAIASVVSKIGSGATAQIITDGAGVVATTQMTSPGSQYLVLPNVTIKPAINTSAAINTLILTPQNYLQEVTVANSSFIAPVGNGYAFAVTDGIIYQKGYFLKSDSQVIVVDKYTDSPNNVVVGFDTAESIISYTADESLLDNATGSPNYTAPGANRLKMSPVLTLLTKEESEANTSFLPLVEFVNGKPYKENRVTVYNTLAKEFERRTHESSGDYVIDPFTVTTKELSTAAGLPNTTHLQVIVDPGTGYIAGSRVQTLDNTLLSLRKGNDTQNVSSQLITTNYGQYIVVQELVGSFDVTAGSSVSLRDTAGYGITNTSIVTSITAPGSEIGTAKVRSVIFDSGTIGLPTAKYRLYLFDIQMSVGKNFRNVKSIYYDGAGNNDALADCYLELDATLNSNVASLKLSSNKALVFDIGSQGTKAISSASFNYRVTDTTNISANTTGGMKITLSAGETFPYTPSSTLSASQEQEVILVPSANLQASANLGGQVVVTNTTMVGTSTTFINDLRVGDYVKVANTGGNSEVFLISSIANNTYASVSANATATGSGGMNTAQANVALFFPAYRPLNFTSRETRTITVSSDQQELTASLGTNLASVTNKILSTYTVRKTNASQVTRTVYRNASVKLQLSNNAAGAYGPWTLGIPDAIRLKKVYIGSTSGVSTTDSDVTKHFYIDSGQNNDYYGHAMLYQLNDSSLALTASDFLLVQIDVLTHSSTGGFNTINSFAIDDANTLASSTATINTMELPEFFGETGTIDLRNAIDFRPIIANTAAITNTVASATLNPANTISLGTSTKYFPVPDSYFTYDLQRYQGRMAKVILNRTGEFQILQGDPGKQQSPATPPDSLNLAVLSIPAYPSIGTIVSTPTSAFLTKRIGNSSGSLIGRNQKHLVKGSNSSGVSTQQPQQYSMKDLASLEHRIQALEYQVSFSKLESEIQKTNIPSTIDATVSRFKNGFFVDSFTDTLKVDQGNKEFACYIDFLRGELHPEEIHLNMQMEFARNDATTSNALVDDSTIMLPYDEIAIISQPKATSTVQSEGNMSQSVGHMMISPAAFDVEARFEQSTIINLSKIPEPPHPQPASGGGSCGGWFGCVIASSLTRDGLWTPYRLKKLEVWGLRTLDKNVIGERFHRGYHVVASKLLIPLLENKGRFSKYVRWGFENGLDVIQRKKINLLALPNSILWIASFLLVGFMVTKDYADKSWKNLYKAKK